MCPFGREKPDVRKSRKAEKSSVLNLNRWIIYNLIYNILYMYIALLFFRIYVMEKAEELELFTAELFKRPLVLQPSAHIGRGLAAISCTMFTKEGM